MTLNLTLYINMIEEQEILNGTVTNLLHLGPDTQMMNDVQFLLTVSQVDRSLVKFKEMS